MTVFAADDVSFIRARMKEIEADRLLASGNAASEPGGKPTHVESVQKTKEGWVSADKDQAYYYDCG